MRRDHLFILLLLTADYGRSIADRAADAKQYTQLYSDIIGASGSLATQFKAINNFGWKLLESSGPIAGIISSVIHGTIDPDSPELEEIKKLHKTMRDGFSDLHSKILEIDYARRISDKQTDYFKEVSVVMSHMQRSFSRFYSYDSDVSFRNMFVDACGEKPNPDTVISWLEGILDKNCKMNSDTDEELYFNLLDVLEVREKESSQVFDLEYRESRIEFISSFLSMTEKDRRNILKRFQSQTGRNQTIDFSTFADANAETDLCYLHIAMLESTSERVLFEKITTTLLRDTVDAAVMAIECYVWRNPGANQTALLKYKKEVGDILSGINQKVYKWGLDRLKRNWPKQSIKEVSKLLPNGRTITEEEYNNVALNVTNALEGRSLNVYGYEVIVLSRNIYDDRESSAVKGMATTAKFQTILRDDVAVIIQRFNRREDIERANNMVLTQTMKNNIEKVLFDNYRIVNIPRLLETVLAHGKLYGSKEYQSIILLRSRHWGGLYFDIPYGARSTLIGNITLPQVVNSRKTDLWIRKFVWHVIFMI